MEEVDLTSSKWKNVVAPDEQLVHGRSSWPAAMEEVDDQLQWINVVHQLQRKK